MAQHMEDMSLVPDPGAQPDPGWYQVRIAKVEETESSKGQPMVKLQMKIQGPEGPSVGRMLFDQCSLQGHALFSLKAYYNAVGYKPAPGQGHDPDNLLDGECWVYFDTKIVDGATLGEIKAHNIKSLQEGPSQARRKSA